MTSRTTPRPILRPILPACLALAACALCPDAALALQVHDAPGEGLYAHQMGHIYYVVALAFFFAYIRRSDFNERSWRYLQAFCILLTAWNLLSFAGHIAALHVAPADLVEFALNLDDRLLPPYTLAKWLYYLARLDNLLCVPALWCLYMAMRTFYQQVLADQASEAREKARAAAPGGEERP